MFESLNVFGRSPFEPLVEHARKVHECVALVRPITEAVLAGNMAELDRLHHDVSRIEYEADQLKDEIRRNLPKRYFLPVRREDVAKFLAQTDKIADEVEDFAVVATFRPLELPEELRGDFLALADKVIQVSESLLGVAEQIAGLQKGGFVGGASEDVLRKIQQVCHMEWESDNLNRRLARHAYGIAGIDAVTLFLLDKLCRALSGLADHAENVGKSLRLMIIRR